MFRRLLPVILLATVLPKPAFGGCNVLVVSNVAPTDPSGGAGNVQLTASIGGTPATLARESSVERISDVLIFDDTAIAGGNCFTTANSIRLTYNASLTRPLSIASATPAYFDVYDSAGSAGLAIQATSNAGLSPGGQPQTVITISVQQAGTAAAAVGGITANPAGSAVRVKNIRVDARFVAAGANVTATVAATSGMPATANVVVGVGQNSIAPGSGVTQAGSGRQSSGGTLDVPAIMTFSENFGTAFRPGGANVSGVYGDVATTPASFTFDVGTALPWGVSLTFPQTISTSVAAGAAGVILNLRSGGTCNGPANCVATYDVAANGPSLSSLTITTAAAPDTGASGSTPAIGLLIANPSGFGDVPLTVSFTPSGLVAPSPNETQGRTTITGWLMRSSNSGSAPAPVIAALSPNAALAGAQGATVTVSGANFGGGSVALWNGSPRATSFMNSTTLSVTITGADFAATGSAGVTILNSDGSTSNVAQFSVIANASPGALVNYTIPHFVSGGGFTSKLTLVNTSTSANSVTVNFLDQAGNVVSSTPYVMAAGATVRIASPESARFGPMTTKWAAIGAQSPLLANVFFEYIPAGTTEVTNSVGFNDSPPLTDFTLPVEFEPANGHAAPRTVGLAIANPNNSSTNVTLKLLDQNGTVLATYGLTLPPNGQTALGLGSLSTFQAVLPNGNFVGSVTVAASAPVSAIALGDDFGPFSATPVGSGRAR